MKLTASNLDFAYAVRPAGPYVPRHARRRPSWLRLLGARVAVASRIRPLVRATAISVPGWSPQRSLTAAAAW